MSRKCSRMPGRRARRPEAVPAYTSPMPRPRSILWVDDEVESLSSQILFLEEQGFSVEKAAHGDDALVLLQRQPYGVVLLDEHMPGRRGLDLFHAIRGIDSTMPVVMVTKSEEPATLKDAIGAEISDYLVKPVNPRQILVGGDPAAGGGPDPAAAAVAGLRHPVPRARGPPQPQPQLA